MFTGPAQDMFKTIFGGGANDKIAGILKYNPSTKLTGAWEIVESVYSNVMVPIALALMMIWLVATIMEKSASEQASPEQFFMVFIKVVAAHFLITRGFNLFCELWGLGISLVEEVTDVISNPPDGDPLDIKKLWKNFTGEEWDKKLGFGDSLSVWFQLLLPWIISQIQIAAVYFLCYSRLIEMMWRICGAPVAVSDFLTEGLHGAGWRYLKNFLAICLQGAIIVIINALYSYIMYDVFKKPPSGAWDTLLLQLSLSFASLALMFKSLSLAKELVGTS